MLDVVIKGGKLVDGLGGKPYASDIGIKDGMIAEIAANITSAAQQSIDASGAIVTPGYVDIHTHYDGQVCWDDTLDPSASHGVTTVIMGNCGVGFAPVPPSGESDLISVMEGVEDIPGTALYEGIDWGRWETFPEYLDYLGSREYALDIGAQVPHAALRNYVMGERGRSNEPATEEDMAAMARLVEESFEAGAVGFSTSRTIGHRAMDGQPIPGTYAADDEIMHFAEVMRKAGKGVFELIPAGCIGELEALGGEINTPEQEIALMDRIARTSGQPVTFTTLQHREEPDAWKTVLAKSAELNASGSQLYPQVASRPIGLVTSLKTYHMFERRETFLKLADLPFEQIVAEMEKPEVRSAILSDRDIPSGQAGMMGNAHLMFTGAAPLLFELEQPINYEPKPEESFSAQAQAKGQSDEEFMYDFLVSKGGSRFAILLGSNFADHDFSAIRDMLMHPETVIGLSDAGAHVNLIFDGVAPTYQMTHWGRDRTRGDKIPIEFLVAKQTKRNADLYGLCDRGSLEVGKRADINVIDFANLHLGNLEVRDDLPAGGQRILQPARGYIATFVKGVQTRSNDRDTGRRPGRLIRA
ncbi:N-acyl-D-amino-acid deacylase family protein [Erythrobacter ani]|uniref:Amidohydrolase family protein n=1 Tax=Erythrobacter ani TaxID=2827235 RepID=A0ABS6SR88_9SPHN|nr:amidohydrolase family protein [Erythrobacter ani]MBV7267530.1 amidohydrolase family protein [Erythrobacter ani]